jgi:hypothetical protein
MQYNLNIISTIVEQPIEYFFVMSSFYIYRFGYYSWFGHDKSEKCIRCWSLKWNDYKLYRHFKGPLHYSYYRAVHLKINMSFDFEVVNLNCFVSTLFIYICLFAMNIRCRAHVFVYILCIRGSKRHTNSDYVPFIWKHASHCYDLYHTRLSLHYG